MTSRTHSEPLHSRDISWMEETFPLREDLIDKAIEQLAAANDIVRRTHAHPFDTTRTIEIKPLSKMLERVEIHMRVTGPFDGYFVASYACPRDDLGGYLVGCYKIFAAMPESYWAAGEVVCGSCESNEASADQAMDNAETLALQKITELRCFSEPH